MRIQVRIIASKAIWSRSPNIGETHTYFTCIPPLRAGTARRRHADSEPASRRRWRGQGLRRVGHLRCVRAPEWARAGHFLAAKLASDGRAAHGSLSMKIPDWSKILGSEYRPSYHYSAGGAGTDQSLTTRTPCTGCRPTSWWRGTAVPRRYR